MSEWISIKEALPELKDRSNYTRSVLATDGKTVFIRQWYSGLGGWGIKRVTHWMDLPKPSGEEVV